MCVSRSRSALAEVGRFPGWPEPRKPSDEVDGRQIAVPAPLDLTKTRGLTVECWLRLDDLAVDQTVVDGRDSEGRGLVLRTTSEATLAIELNDGDRRALWDCDPGLLTPGQLHHVVAIVDSGPGIITFLVDGVLCGGGEARTHGWGRFDPALGDVTGSAELRLAPVLHGDLERLRVYNRYLRTSEAISKGAEDGNIEIAGTGEALQGHRQEDDEGTRAGLRSQGNHECRQHRGRC